MRFALLVAFLWGWVGSAAAQTQSGPVVLELFTSQGCSSCPPADALLVELSEHKDVLPLALHVDYWDYIGWPDAFASPQYTKRQKAYARLAGRSMIYTPQIIVGGVTDIAGYKPMKTMQAIEAHKALPAFATVSAARDGDKLRIDVAPQGEARPVDVVLVRYMPRSTVSIRGGENAGRTVDYVNIVTEWHVLTSWDGQSPHAWVTEFTGEDAGAILLQVEGPGAVLAAARVR
jgi:hypothetical protein